MPKIDTLGPHMSHKAIELPLRWSISIFSCLVKDWYPFSTSRSWWSWWHVIPRKSFSLLKACLSLRCSPCILSLGKCTGQAEDISPGHFLQIVSISTHVSECAPNRTMIFPNLLHLFSSPWVLPSSNYLNKPGAWKPNLPSPSQSCSVSMHQALSILPLSFSQTSICLPIFSIQSIFLVQATVLSLLTRLLPPLLSQSDHLKM